MVPATPGMQAQLIRDAMTVHGANQLIVDEIDLEADFQALRMARLRSVQVLAGCIVVEGMHVLRHEFVESLR